MFYQINVNGQELAALRQYHSFPGRPDIAGPRLLSKALPALEALQGDAEGYKTLQAQGDIIAVRSVLLKIWGDKIGPQIPRPYYLIARYFQETYGWFTLSEYERETISPFLEALLESGKLSGVVPEGAPKLPLVVTTPEAMLEHIQDFALLGRLASAHLVTGRFIREVPGVIKLETMSTRDYIDICPICMCVRENMKRCSRCKVRFYCSSAHQAIDWREVHSRECSAYAKAIGDVFSRAEAEAQEKKQQLSENAPRP